MKNIKYDENYINVTAISNGINIEKKENNNNFLLGYLIICSTINKDESNPFLI